LEGQIFTHKKEKNILTSISLPEMLADNYQSIEMDKKLGDLIELVKSSDKNVFAVHDKKGLFAGLIELNDIRQKLFQPEQFEKLSIKSIMKKPASILYTMDTMNTVMDKFDLSQSWYLPVLG
jgi:CIC family chloride channel protein